jgi:hypothetical protein
MNRDRLALALSKIPFTAWADFENFASEFLAAEFPGLRTTARPAGDKGRDSEIVDIDSPVAGTRIKLQYSVTLDWSKKISGTVNTLIENDIKPTHLIYATNQHIGAEGDHLKSSIFTKYGVVVDIRDDTYFLDRRDSNPATQAASEELARKFVDPLLPTEAITAAVAPALTIQEERLAFLHLSIDLHDRTGDRNLTKSAFDSLILAMLHGSHAESRIPIADVKKKVKAIVGSGAPGQVDAQIDNAISRLQGKHGRIKLHSSDNTLHIAYDEQQTIDAAAQEFLRQEQSLERDILAALYEQNDELDADSSDTAAAINDVRRCIEGMMWEYGEQFVDALRGSSPVNLLFGDIFEHYLTSAGFESKLSQAEISRAIQTVVEEGCDDGKAFLGRLLDSYTILALLKSTPDVQKALRKVVSGDQIWVDTSFLLPVLADRMGGGEHPFETLVETCNAVGIRLFVTDGVIQEIDAHLRICVAVARRISTPPRYPYLLAKFIENGHPVNAFPDWQEDIRGELQPLSDITEYLKDEHHIAIRSLTSEVEVAPAELRLAATEYLRQFHELRRGADVDAFSVDRLIDHDVESIVGVIELRKLHRDTPGSYRYWWLTLDRKARTVTSALTDETGRQYDNVAISPGYLAQLIRLAPSILSSKPKPAGHTLILLDLARSQSISPAVVEKIETLRESIPGLTSRRIRRVIRDELNRQKSDDSDGEFLGIT